ncbi:cyclin-dependent kinase inhibitor 1Ba [Corythoichthys intestinalis]|uniref:cyclin-dependent kinase inhibitor 1Ba n=1 Tax=Corythoichthys intestinalis TaxID=161448 RepID=UPI0025A4D9BD|nr:cyclin-dependent kinase inhibitor 1Ba [Corythoichthys intestinalis]XP_061809441.1 cyclin-dependent kinase inhibitor 1B-like [Nerophis lumbriciformis]
MCNKMSDVRLSNASPPLERVDPRQQDRVRLPVCRNLFGTPDPAEILASVTANSEDNARSFAERYNFDLLNDEALPGVFEWTEDRDAPEFYSRPPHRKPEPRRDDSGESQRSQNRDSSKKRPSDSTGSPSEFPAKRSHSRGDDDDEPPRDSGAPVQ